MSKQFNPIGHADNKKDIITTYASGIEGMETLLNAWHYTNENEPNYFLIHPIDLEVVKRETFNNGYHNPNINGWDQYKGIKIIRSYDLQQGQIQLV